MHLKLEVFSKAFFTGLMAVALLLSGDLPKAEATTVFDDGGVSIVTGIIDDIEVRDSIVPSSTLVISSGAQVGFIDDPMNGLISSNEDQSVAVFGNSTVSMTGGETADSVVGNENSTTTISAGVIGDDLIVRDSAFMSFAGTSADDVDLSGNAVFAMSSGSVDTVTMVDNATFQFLGGRIDDLGDDDEDLIGGTSRVFMQDGALIDDDAFFFGSSSLQATGGTIDDELQFYDNSFGFFTGGSVGDDLVVADDAVVDIVSLTVSDTIEAEGGTVNIQDGSFGAIEALEGSPVTMLGGTVEESLLASQSSTILFQDSTAPDGFSVTAALRGEIEMVDANFEGAAVLDSTTNGLIEVEGGILTQLDVNAAAGTVVLDVDSADSLNAQSAIGGLIQLFGGAFGSSSLVALSGSTIEIYGLGFTVNGIPFPNGGSVPFVAGVIEADVLSNGSPFSTTFSRQFSPLNQAATILLINIPEPGTMFLALIALSGVAGRPRR